jgi:hypothetical protein
VISLESGAEEKEGFFLSRLTDAGKQEILVLEHQTNTGE